MKIYRIIMKWSPGSIYDLMSEAQSIAGKYECIVEFQFNGVTVEVEKGADVMKGCERVMSMIGANQVVRVGE